MEYAATFTNNLLMANSDIFLIPLFLCHWPPLTVLFFTVEFHIALR